MKLEGRELQTMRRGEGAIRMNEKVTHCAAANCHDSRSAIKLGV